MNRQRFFASIASVATIAILATGCSSKQDTTSPDLATAMTRYPCSSLITAGSAETTWENFLWSQTPEAERTGSLLAGDESTAWKQLLDTRNGYAVSAQPSHGKVKLGTSLTVPRICGKDEAPRALPGA